MFGALFGVLKAAVSAVFQAVTLVIKLVYRVLAFLHLRLIALYVLVCAILAIFFPVFTDGIAYFWVGFGIAAAITLAVWFFCAKRALARRPRKLPAEEGAPEEPAAEKMPPAERRAAPAPEPPPAPKPRYPLYFDVEGHPGYFFAEYADRYELYRWEETGAVYIRTDRKQDPYGG